MKDSDPPLTPELLLQAYASGVFPMSESRDDPHVFWVDPRQRGILPLDQFHVSRSLAKTLKRGDFYATRNAAFSDVLDGCADRDETWISDSIYRVYRQLHEMGFAHSIEVWRDNVLAGGVYGVTLGGAFFGESMFSRATDASKVALAYAVDHLVARGFTLFDTQFTTPHLISLGAVEISRDDYQDVLEDALQIDGVSFGSSGQMRPSHELLHLRTQTS